MFSTWYSYGAQDLQGIASSARVLAAQWLQVRTELGISDSTKLPLMPAPGPDDNATARPISTSQAGAWVMMLLSKCGDLGGVVYTWVSHSRPQNGIDL